MTHDTSLPRHKFPDPRYAIVLACVGIALFLTTNWDWLPYKRFIDGTTGWGRAGLIISLAYVPLLLMLTVLTSVVVGVRRVPEAFGLNRPALPALGFAFAITALLPVIYALMGGLSVAEDSLRDFLTYAVVSGTFEEIAFRAVLVGIPCRVLGWRFWPTAIIAAVLFGVLHLDQSEDLMESAMIFAITGIGGVWFAWLFRAWNWNLWVPIGFHVMMNGWWTVFDMDDTALGSWGSIAARGAVVVLSVVLTLRYVKVSGTISDSGNV